MVVMPKSLQIKAIQIAHEGHLEVEKCKSLLRMKVYWPNMNFMVNDFIRGCTACKANSRDPPPEPLKTSELSENVWAEIRFFWSSAFRREVSSHYRFILKISISRSDQKHECRSGNKQTSENIFYIWVSKKT